MATIDATRRRNGAPAAELRTATCPKHSPWGPVQHATEIIPGIWSVGTASHGGIKLAPQRQKHIPEYMRCEAGWYEEDCNWCIPFLVFEAEIRAAGDEYACKSIDSRQHVETLRNWHPDQFERFFGVQLQEGESYLRDQKLFHERHADDFVVISARRVEGGMVHCTATLGGERDWALGQQPRRESREYLVPEDEYAARHPFGFVIDPARHQRVR